MRSPVRLPGQQSKQLAAGEFFRGEHWPGGGRTGWKVRRCVHGHVNQDPGIGTADDWPWPSQDRETSPWRRPGDPLVLVKRSQGRLKTVRPAKPLKPRRDLQVIQFRMIAAAGAYQLIHAGIAALDAAVHDAGWLVPQGRLTAVAGLTGGRRCHDPLNRDTHRSARGAGTAHFTHPPGAGSRSCHYQGPEQRRCYPQTVARRGRYREDTGGQHWDS